MGCTASCTSSSDKRHDSMAKWKRHSPRSDSITTLANLSGSQSNDAEAAATSNKRLHLIGPSSVSSEGDTKQQQHVAVYSQHLMCQSNSGRHLQVEDPAATIECASPSGKNTTNSGSGSDDENIMAEWPEQLHELLNDPRHQNQEHQEAPPEVAPSNPLHRPGERRATLNSPSNQNLISLKVVSTPQQSLSSQQQQQYNETVASGLRSIYSLAAAGESNAQRHHCNQSQFATGELTIGTNATMSWEEADDEDEEDEVGVEELATPQNFSPQSL